eukprot:gb/GECG01003239.1/.p1 GENE.gb/GECG01003239.1/~~gb/GECG01003239.1/.p1  ORF type:complete len:423 (+),score=24.21 gb/GECG01003239.1/:1-1269(+)
MAPRLGPKKPQVVIIHSDDPDECPLLITPKHVRYANTSCLTQWIEDNKDFLSERLREHGAIKFQGFNLDDARDFEKVATAYEGELSTAYRGTTPRTLQEGTNAIFSAAEFSSVIPIAQHIEMSFLPYPPQRLFFFCHTPPKEFGETSLCDFRKVWRDLDPQVREELEVRGLKYVRNYHKGPKWYYFDPTKLKGWEALFGTSDKHEINRECQKTSQNVEWNGDDLRITNEAGPTRVHPETGEVAMSNHLLIFHPCMFGQESWHVFKRTWRLVEFLKFIIGTIFCWLYLLLVDSRDSGMNTLYADGTDTPVSTKTIGHIRDVSWKHMIFPKWEKGDVLMIDNRIVSHGRQPSAPPRKILVAWSPAVQDPAPLHGAKTPENHTHTNGVATPRSRKSRPSGRSSSASGKRSSSRRRHARDAGPYVS